MKIDLFNILLSAFGTMNFVSGNYIPSNKYIDQPNNVTANEIKQIDNFLFKYEKQIEILGSNWSKLTINFRAAPSMNESELEILRNRLKMIHFKSFYDLTISRMLFFGESFDAVGKDCFTAMDPYMHLPVTFKCNYHDPKVMNLAYAMRPALKAMKDYLYTYYLPHLLKNDEQATHVKRSYEKMHEDLIALEDLNDPNIKTIPDNLNRLMNKYCPGGLDAASMEKYISKLEENYLPLDECILNGLKSKGLLTAKVQEGYDHFYEIYRKHKPSL